MSVGVTSAPSGSIQVLGVDSHHEAAERGPHGRSAPKLWNRCSTVASKSIGMGISCRALDVRTALSYLAVYSASSPTLSVTVIVTDPLTPGFTPRSATVRVATFRGPSVAAVREAINDTKASPAMPPVRRLAVAMATSESEGRGRIKHHATKVKPDSHESATGPTEPHLAARHVQLSVPSASTT